MEKEQHESILKALKNISSEFSYIENSCIFAHVSSESTPSANININKRFKVSGLVFMVVTKGQLVAELDTTRYEVGTSMSVVLMNGAMVHFDVQEDKPFEAYILAYTESFLHDLNISYTAISTDVLSEKDNPTFTLSEREVPLLLRFYTLIHNVMTDTFNQQLNRHIVSSLTSGLFYEYMLLIYKRVDTGTSRNAGPRRSTYVQDFLKLVHIYFTRERQVNFYAEKLFISPKYLSMLVKEATGRSATRWIEHFVITEAKNLLRYSGKNVQQVAYALNFSNQSSFGKYFKHITGMSPTEYQKS